MRFVSLHKYIDLFSSIRIVYIKKTHNFTAILYYIAIFGANRLYFFFLLFLFVFCQASFPHWHFIFHLLAKILLWPNVNDCELNEWALVKTPNQCRVGYQHQRWQIVLIARRQMMKKISKRKWMRCRNCGQMKCARYHIDSRPFGSAI